ncbi:hypothetical protein OB955_07625 [Halobacteria archaeon AArc-m2/3/4]|uniref:DUF8006 domain-containing protein n=1 Tax=Natronoglomus mannanivorans TaxID=2979990 RepID=A0AAP2YWQ8_9EURY|nr:hypothetical protein [Halobacteria archaeon AArc-xg1-1]MCU4972607.1 hypothetical protein [Halobacteria archaeon AArc-m2/3/4]
MIEVPLQTIDNMLMPFHVGHILLGAFALAILGTLPLKSMKVVGLNIIAFGAIFLLLPVDMAGNTIVYRLFGAVLVIVGPMLYAAADS